MASSFSSIFDINVACVIAVVDVKLLEDLETQKYNAHLLYTYVLSFTVSATNNIRSKKSQQETEQGPGSPLFFFTFFASLTNLFLRLFHFLEHSSTETPSPT